MRTTLFLFPVITRNQRKSTEPTDKRRHESVTTRTRRYDTAATIENLRGGVSRERVGARSPSRRRRQVDQCGDKSAQMIRHELRYARPAVLPSTGAPWSSWNRLPHSAPAPGSGPQPSPRHTAARSPDPPLPPRSLHSPDHLSPLSPLPPTPVIARPDHPILPPLATLLLLPPYPFRCHDPYLETLGNEQPPSKTGSVTRATIILQTWLVDAYPINCRPFSLSLSLSLSLSRIPTTCPLAFSFTETRYLRVSTRILPTVFRKTFRNWILTTRGSYVRSVDTCVSIPKIETNSNNLFNAVFA